MFSCQTKEILDPHLEFESIAVEGNVLDAVLYKNVILLSLDNIHTAGTKEVNASPVRYTQMHSNGVN